MKVRTSKYPIGILLLTVIDNSGLSPSSFLKEIGYESLTGGFKTLDAYLEEGDGDRLLLDRIQGSRFAVVQEALERVAQENADLLAAQKIQNEFAKRQVERARFRPYLEVIPELLRPTQITFFGLTGGNRRYNTYLPQDIATWDYARQTEFLKVAVTENFVKHDGRTAFMGQIQGYLYFYSYDEQPLRLTVSGEVDASADPVVRAGVGCAYLD